MHYDPTHSEAEHLNRERYLFQWNERHFRESMAAPSSRQVCRGCKSKDALAIYYAFNVTNRLANAFGFELMAAEGFQSGAKYLLWRDYQ